MAHDTGIATSLDDLVNKIVVFAAANTAFTDDGTIGILASDYQNRAATLRVLTNGDVNICLFSVYDGSEYKLVGAMTYDLPSEGGFFGRTQQTGQSHHTEMSIYKQSETFSSDYYIFSQNNCVHCALEVYPNVFTHISLGWCEKAGAYTGGEYISANACDDISSNNYDFTDSNNAFLFDYDAGSVSRVGYFRRSISADTIDDFFPIGQSRSPGVGVDDAEARMAFHYQYSLGSLSNSSGLYSYQFARSSDTATLRNTLLDIPIITSDVLTGGPWPYCGKIEGAKLVNMKNLAARDIIDGDWQVFPYCQNGGDTTIAPDSGIAGVAYKRA